MKQGYVLPRALTQKVIPQMTALTRAPAEQHPFYAPIRQMPLTFSESDRQRLTQAYRTLIREKIIPAFQELEKFLKEEYLPASRATSGIAAIPNGREYYNLQIKTFTTTDLTADQIFDLGESEVKRLTGEMEKVKQSVGFDGDLKAFFQYVRTRKELMPFTEPQQVLDNFQAIRKKMEPSLNRLFKVSPRTPLEIRRKPVPVRNGVTARWTEPGQAFSISRCQM
jgi:uncharacterized protein (DUF885 family)